MIRHLARSQRGSAAVEFAVVLPMLVLLLIGLIDVGRYTYYGILAQHAARAGLQYGAQTSLTAQDNTGIQNAALADAQNLSNWQVSRSIVCQIGGSQSSCPANNANTLPANLVYFVQVQVTGSFKTLISYPGIPNPVPVTATASMRVGSQ